MSSYPTALFGAALALAVSSAGAATLDGSAAAASTALGGTATVELALSVSDPVVLLGLTLNLDWDAGLSFDSAMIFGQDLASFIARFDPQFTVRDQSPGHLGVALLADVIAPSLPGGSASMSFSFTGQAEGVQNVRVALSLTDDSFNDIPLALDSTVTVTPVPEASPAAMLIAGLAAVGLLARRRHRPS